MMRTAPGTRHIIFGMVFLLSGLMGQAHALTVRSLKKDVTIDTDWHITGRYTRIFEITQSVDTRKLDQIIGQLERHTNPSAIVVTRVHLPDGSDIPWASVGKNDLPTGTQVRLLVTIKKNFPGFSGLFSDTMQIDQSVPVKHVSYRIKFPREIPFIHQVNLKKNEPRKDSDCGDGFTWSGEDVRHLDILVSTATSWDQITRRYQTLFQNRLGKGLLPADLPEMLREIKDVASPDEKIQAVMRFLHHDMTYRRSPDPAQALLPAPPRTVLDRGWGDCKDLALLGTALLGEMSVNAFVVLTASPRLDLPKEALPDPFIFDHALVGFDHNGQTTYYDCTTPEPVAAVNKQHIYLPLKMFENKKKLASITHCDIPITY